MTYYKDLTFFQYTQSSWVFESNFPYILLNAGWLDKRQYYMQEAFDNTIKEKLLWSIFNYCANPVNLTTGHHTCNLCSNEYGRILNAQRKGKKINLGNGEIFVKGINNIVYVAPTLIYHYIQVHNYKPPVEFTDAVLANSTIEDFMFFKKMETRAKYNKKTTKRYEDSRTSDSFSYLFYDEI